MSVLEVNGLFLVLLLSSLPDLSTALFNGHLKTVPNALELLQRIPHIMWVISTLVLVGAVLEAFCSQLLCITS